nr:hypothetical protein B0A51_11591 [Rachicladosporium sp. CCFEE 5018]
MSKLQLQWQTEGSNAPFHNGSISRCNDSLLYNKHLFNLDEPRQARRMGIGLLEKPFARIYVKNGKKPNDHALKEIAFQVMVKKRDAEVKAALIKGVDSSTTAVISSPVGSTLYLRKLITGVRALYKANDARLVKDVHAVIAHKLISVVSDPFEALTDSMQDSLRALPRLSYE